jgi:hypothetical protein
LEQKIQDFHKEAKKLIGEAKCMKTKKTNLKMGTIFHAISMKINVLQPIVPPFVVNLGQFRGIHNRRAGRG